jgi:hypothetical protein
MLARTSIRFGALPTAFKNVREFAIIPDSFVSGRSSRNYNGTAQSISGQGKRTTAFSIGILLDAATIR